MSIDAPFYPEYEGRNYDYARIANACDYLFVMACKVSRIALIVSLPLIKVEGHMNETF